MEILRSGPLESDAKNHQHMTVEGSSSYVKPIDLVTDIVTLWNKAAQKEVVVTRQMADNWPASCFRSLSY